MTTPLASLQQLTARLAPGVDVDQTRAQACLEDASALVRTVARTTWLDDAGALDSVPDVVTTITLAVARRMYENPTGITQESTGPFSATYTPDAAQVMYLTDTERDVLERISGSSGLWQLGTTRNSLVDAAPIGWFETEGATEPSGGISREPL